MSRRKPGKTPPLTELGVAKKRSSRARKLAEIAIEKIKEIAGAMATGRDEPIEWLKRWGAVK